MVGRNGMRMGTEWEEWVRRREGGGKKGQGEGTKGEAGRKKHMRKEGTRNKKVERRERSDGARQSKDRSV